MSELKLWESLYIFDTARLPFPKEQDVKPNVTIILCIIRCVSETGYDFVFRCKKGGEEGSGIGISPFHRTHHIGISTWRWEQNRLPKRSGLVLEF
jgi:hypothetical protein